ncbi:ABC transporter ATP-binding protein [Mesorhizobium sp. LHD-90]|uniref:ABC transporter ATP-binding protein n=1 Tax=Mesorhizobium sp. LHD-90 TaxID=3071414 RepID=UPI0027E07058|nr:ABC transporter ATP-binding protein [Mesorhizobium sp. LHD-90]MDQ6433196.1 ABC transporter ATP-binding protein [Mesorhizobium sp. LHD-90]
MKNLLDVRGLSKRFGGLTAVSDISFSMKRGEIFGIIGPNGAGKTTLFNVIAGQHKASAGGVTFDERDISGYSSDAIARLGIGRTFQAVTVFKSETVAENLRRANVLRRRHNPLAVRSAAASEDRFRAVASFIGLGDHLDGVAGDLAYGLQKLLGVGMAMLIEPKLLLMDEPAAGLNPSEKREAGTLIRRLRDELGISILLIEHDMPLVMDVCDRILVMSQGAKVALDTPSEIKRDSRVIDAYLGDDYDFA